MLSEQAVPSMAIAEQRSAALEVAQAVRLRRVAFRRELKQLDYAEGCAVLADALGQVPPWLVTAQAFDVLSWPSRMGTTRARALLGSAEVRGPRAVGELSERQREVLAARLREPRVAEIATTKAGASVSAAERAEERAARRAQLLEMWNAGTPSVEIGRTLGWSRRTVTREVSRLRVAGYTVASGRRGKAGAAR